jgi:hypothetical protein
MSPEKPLTEGDGIYWYCGAPTAGKTTLALANLRNDILRTRRPALIIDSQSVGGLRDIPHSRGVRDTIVRVWKEGSSCAYTPTSIEEVSRIAEAIRLGKRVHVLIDEARYWMSSHSITPELSRLMRVWQHAEITVHLTTQRLQDIHGDAIACTTKMFAFRCVDPRTLERLQKDFGFDPDEIRNLPRGSYKVWDASF